MNRHVYIIAEIGINHNGDVSLAKELVDVASETGCDAVKFQKREPDICVPEDQKLLLRETPWGTMTYLDYKKRIEFGEAEYDEIDRYCMSKGIDWSASAWDLPSQKFLQKYKRLFNKIASAMITNVELLNEVADEGLLTYISTGMSTLEQIDTAVDIFKSKGTPFEIMHSVSTYPARDEDLNLQVIQTLRNRYNVPVGYSGHEPTVSPSIVAAALGASVIERHITTNRSNWGTDQSASLEPAGLRFLVGAVRKVPIILGDGVKRVLPEEELIARKLRTPIT
jgi:N-acetylneuraminate synthase